MSEITGILPFDIHAIPLTGEQNIVHISGPVKKGKADQDKLLGTSTGQVGFIIADLTAKDTASTLELNKGVWDGFMFIPDAVEPRIGFIGAPPEITISESILYQPLIKRDPVKQRVVSIEAIQMQTIGDADIKAHVRTQGKTKKLGTINLYETFEPYGVKDTDIAGQGGWFADGPGLPDALMVVDDTKLLERINSATWINNSGSSKSSNYGRTVKQFLAATDVRRISFLFQVNLGVGIVQGPFVWFKNSLPLNDFTNVPMYISLQDSGSGNGRLILDTNAGTVLDDTDAYTLGVKHLAIIEFKPPNLFEIKIDGKSFGTFATTSGEEDYTHIAISNTLAASGAENDTFFVDQIVDFSPEPEFI